MDYVLCDQEMKPAMQIIVSKIVFIQGSVIFPLASCGFNDKMAFCNQLKKWTLHNIPFTKL